MNQRADAWSLGHLLLFQLNACILDFEHLKTLYEDDKTLGIFIRIVKGTPREISPYMMCTCSRVPNCVSLSVVLGSCLLGRSIEDPLPAIMGRTTPYLC